MTPTTKLPRPPAAFQRLAWSNLVAQSADQIALAAAPIVAVFALGVAEGRAGLLQTALTLPFVVFAIPAGLRSHTPISHTASKPSAAMASHSGPGTELKSRAVLYTRLRSDNQTHVLIS